MSALARLRAWQAEQAALRQIVVEDGLPSAVREAGGLSRYTWQAGELAEIVEADGEAWRYAYGADGRLLAVERNGQRWADYRYDASGRLSEVQRADGPLAHAYDEQGRLQRTLRGDASPLVYRWQGERVLSARCDREEAVSTTMIKDVSSVWTSRSTGANCRCAAASTNKGGWPSSFSRSGSRRFPLPGTNAVARRESTGTASASLLSATTRRTGAPGSAAATGCCSRPGTRRAAGRPSTSR